MDITIYSTGCPRCKMIETILKSKGVEYKIVSDEETIEKTAKEHDFKAMPFAKINGDFYNSTDLQTFAREAERK